MRSGTIIDVFTIGLIACKGYKLSGSQVRDLAWQSLKPHTSPHNLDNWVYIEVKQVTGREVADKFRGDPAPGCWQGPLVDQNEKINPHDMYWYVHLKPREVTPLPTPTAFPAASPYTPEPFISQAFFLLDPANGRVGARKISCVIY